MQDFGSVRPTGTDGPDGSEFVDKGRIGDSDVARERQRLSAVSSGTSSDAVTYEGRALTAAESGRVLELVGEGVTVLEDRLARLGAVFQREPMVGHELEYVLMDAHGRPAPGARSLIREHESLKAELSAFNLETDSTPIKVGPTFLHELSAQLGQNFREVHQAAQAKGLRAAVVGILPGYRLDDFDDAHFIAMRYRNLDASVKALGDPPHHQISLDGPEGITTQAESLLVEAMNTSFQLHLSAAPDEIVDLYNVVQAATGPVLAAMTNSPFVLGKACWMESRIPIWRQTTLPEQVPFGKDWISDPIDPLRELKNIHPILMDPSTVYPGELGDRQAREERALRALAVQNGTVWRWNRICFSAEPGQEHLRIENRAFPAGPTTLEMAANAALYYGVVHGLLEELKDSTGRSVIGAQLDFHEVKRNFYHSARKGLDAELRWFGNGGSVETLTGQELVTKLLPIAHRGLELMGVPAADRDFYLEKIIRPRVESKHTGAHWQLASVKRLEQAGLSREDALTEVADQMQLLSGKSSSEWRGFAPPVHTWELARTPEERQRDQSDRE